MEFSGHHHGSDSQDCDEPAPAGTALNSPSTSIPSPAPSCSSKGVENAKKRLRAFSIQKKAPVGPVTVVKPVCTGNTTVLIGKLCSSKVTPKPEKPPDDDKKTPKPPKPGGSRKLLNESYSELQKKTLSEIEDMKRKMELVELGIPLGLVCPSTNAIPAKAMPTKAMPPIKTFLADSFRVIEASTPTKKKKKVKANKNKRKTVKKMKGAKSDRKSLSPHRAKIDEIIRLAQKAKAEGKEFKFDYQKFVPDYDNPFQRKRDQFDSKPEELERIELPEKRDDELKKSRSDKDRRGREFKEHDRRKGVRFERRQGFKRDNRDKIRDKGRTREKVKKEEGRSKSRDDKSKDSDSKSKDRDDKHKKDDKPLKKDVKAEDKDFSRKTKDEKKEQIKSSTEKPLEKQQDKDGKETDVNLKDYLVCDSWSLDTEGKNSPQVENKTKNLEDKSKKSIGKDLTAPADPLEQLKKSLGKGNPASPKLKVEKLKPVVDCFEFEIDPNEDELLDNLDEDQSFGQTKSKKDILYDSRKDHSNDGMTEDNFLESIINEIKQEDMTDDEHHDKGLVEYDESPVRDSNEPSVGSITPDLEDSIRGSSQTSDYSDGHKSVDSLKSLESGYKSSESKGFEDKANPKFTDGNFKPIESVDKSDEYVQSSAKFRSTFKPSENVLKAKSERRSRDRSKSSESILKIETSQKASKNVSKPYREQRELLSVERELDEALEAKMSKDTVDSLETWSFVMKICQPLLFRHDKNKCYKETRTVPKLWFTANPKICNCVTDRSIVYEELERCKMDLVYRLYACDQIPDAAPPAARAWYPAAGQWVSGAGAGAGAGAAPDLCSEWDDVGAATPRPAHHALNIEYQRFMEAVSWAEPQQERSLTPERAGRKGGAGASAGPAEGEGGAAKRAKVSSEGWSQESDVDDLETSKTQKTMKVKQKEKRKRKRSPSTLSTGSDSDHGDKKKKKTSNKKKTKSKPKRRRLEKKVLKKLKEKKKKKKEKMEEESDLEEEKEAKKKEKKIKKKKQQKIKKKAEKKRKRGKSTSTSSSDSSSSDSSSESEVAIEKKAKKKKKKPAEVKKKKKVKKKKRHHSTSESQSEDLFDVNVLNNIKSERLTDDEKKETRVHREIINVKELQDEFSSNIQIKQEVDDVSKKPVPVEGSPKEKQELSIVEDKSKDIEDSNTIEDALKKEVIVKEIADKVEETEVTKKIEDETKEIEMVPKKVDRVKRIDVGKLVESSKMVEVSEMVAPRVVESELEMMNRFDLESYDPEEKIEKLEFKEAEAPTPPPRLDDLSQGSSESPRSAGSARYEKDDEHLRPCSDNSNYSFHDVISSHAGYKGMEEKFEGYENYEMYEQMAMAYQSDVASQQISPPSCYGEQRIETVVRARARGEIKCDWRASDGPAPETTPRPSRWGLRPGEVNIVLTGGADPPAGAPPPVYRIQSLANRDTSTGYDEAYMDMYGAADRLQYGDCFAPSKPPPKRPAPPHPPARSLSDRIDRALRTSVLGEVARDENDKETPEKGILLTKCYRRGSKRVSFADGYRPGQDSDTEEPPVKKRARARRVGCAWPCPAAHPDHVPLWDALPPPPPPRGSPPPPPPAPPPPLHLLRDHRYKPLQHAAMPPLPHKFNPASAIPNFMPPEPPPGLISFP